MLFTNQFCLIKASDSHEVAACVLQLVQNSWEPLETGECGYFILVLRWFYGQSTDAFYLTNVEPASFSEALKISCKSFSPSSKYCMVYKADK